MPESVWEQVSHQNARFQTSPDIQLKTVHCLTDHWNSCETPECASFELRRASCAKKWKLERIKQVLD